MEPFALPDAAPTAPGQLYNLDTDPGETNNLYFKQPDIVQKLKTLLERSKSGSLRNGRSEIREPQGSN